MLLPPARFCRDLPTAYRDCRQRKCFGWGWRGSSLHTFFFYPKVCLREEELQQFDPCCLLGVVLLSAFLEIQKTRVTQKSASGLKKISVYFISSVFTKGFWCWDWYFPVQKKIRFSHCASFSYHSLQRKQIF